MGLIFFRGVVIAGITIAVMLGPAALAEPGRRLNHLPIVAPSTGPITVTVESRDHLWKLSEAHLLEVLGREPEGSEVSPYWLTVIRANQDSLRSGDPNLIFPGEKIKLPGVS